MSNGTINGQSYVSRRNAWNKWDDWLEQGRDQDTGTKFDPVSFRAEIEAAKSKGLIKYGPVENLCRNCNVVVRENRTHCEKCAAYFTDLKKRANEIVTRTCPECGIQFQKRLKARNVVCSEPCRVKRHIKQRRGSHPPPPIRGTEY